MSSSSISVLLVDDEYIALACMRFALESMDAQVDDVESIAEALEHLHRSSFDVAVIDLHLSDGSGYDLARWLLKNRPQMPLVMISVDFYDPGNPPPRLRDNIPIVLLAKPFSVSELLAAISKAKERIKR